MKGWPWIDHHREKTMNRCKAQALALGTPVHRHGQADRSPAAQVGRARVGIAAVVVAT